jgi:hypothetical protein
MNRKEWQAIYQAKELLGLGDKATTGEMKRAYRKLAKEHHPDINQDNREENGQRMQELTWAYELLMRYSAQFRIPLIPDDVEKMDPEDWWLDRFGQDPLWGKQERK